MERRPGARAELGGSSKQELARWGQMGGKDSPRSLTATISRWRDDGQLLFSHLSLALAFLSLAPLLKSQSGLEFQSLISTMNWVGAHEAWLEGGLCRQILSWNGIPALIRTHCVVV